MIDAEQDDLPDDVARVFLSYSRRDRESAQRIADVLRQRDFGVFRDTDDILPTEEWRGRLEELIAEADTVVFLLSPHSVASEVCAWEVEYATALNKRIAPIVIEEAPTERIPPLLARLNFIFCTSSDPFENAISTLVAALNTDIDWIREHTRIGGLAKRWEREGRPTRFLPRGQDIADAEAWRDGRPKDAPAITPLQADYIREGRRVAGRRQRQWIAGSLGIAAATAVLAAFAYLQSVEADRQRVQAEAQRALAQANAREADAQRARAVEQRDLAEVRLREALAERTRRNVSDAEAMLEEGRYRDAAQELVTALTTAGELGDEDLLATGETASRRLIVDDRLYSILDGRFADPSSYPALTMAADGQSLIGRDKGRLWLWSAESGDLRAQTDNVEAAAYRRDGAVIAIRQSPGRGGILIAIDPVSGAPTLLAESDLLVFGAWLFPYADLALVVGLRDEAPNVAAYALASGELLFDRPGRLPRPRLVAVSESGRTLALAETNGTEVVVLNRTGALLDRFSAPGDVSGLGFAFSGETILLRTDSGFWLKQIGDGARRITIDERPADEIEFIGPGQVVAQEGIAPARLLDIESLEEIRRFEGETIFGVIGPGLDRKTIVTHGAQRFAVFDVATGALRNRFGRTSPPLGGWRLSADGRYLASIHKTGLVSVWSVEEGRETMTVMPRGGGRRISMFMRPEGPMVAVIDGDGRIGLWRGEAGALATNDALSVADPVFTSHIGVSGDFTRPARIWDVASGRLLRTLDHGLIQSVDPISRRALIDLGAEGPAVFETPEAPPTKLEWRGLALIRKVAWGARSLAIANARGVEVFDIASGKHLGVAPPLEDGLRIVDMAFAPDDAALTLLTSSGALIAANWSRGTTETVAQLPSGVGGRSMHTSASGAVLLIRGASGVFRYEVVDGRLETVADPADHGVVLAAGPHAAIVQTGDVETRALRVIDIETGAERFRPTWRGGAYALGAADRIIVEETSSADVYFLDAQTGAARGGVSGDGGVGGQPFTPRISADETLALAVNGGGEMARLIDVAAGRQIAGAPRRDGFLGHTKALPDLSVVSFDQIGQSGRVFYFADALLTGAALADEVRRRYPAPATPEINPDADACDVAASDAVDPSARAEGVAAHRLDQAAFDLCGRMLTDGVGGPRTAYLFARIATQLSPDQDGEAANLLRAAAQAGYAAAYNALGRLYLQGRAGGDLGAAEAAFRQASKLGVGAATAVLARMADRGMIADDPEALLVAGAEAGQPYAMGELARRRAQSGDYQAATRLMQDGAAALAARSQGRAAERFLDRAAVYARRVGRWR